MFLMDHAFCQTRSVILLSFSLSSSPHNRPKEHTSYFSARLLVSRCASRGIDRALYLPEEWTADRVRCREASIPDEVGFATKGELAQQMLARAFAAGVPADWVLGDTIYGYDEMRMVLEKQQKNYVLAVPETHTVWVQGRQQPVGLLAALLPQEAWVVLSAGEGSKGPRLYEWAWLLLPAETEAPSMHARW